MINLDDFTSREFVGALFLIQVGVFTSEVSRLVVEGNMAHLLLHHADNVEVLGGKGSTSSDQLTHERLSNVLSSNFSILHSVGQGVTFKDRDGVSDTFSALSDQTTSLTSGEEGEDGSVDQGERLYLEMFEHELGDLALVILIVKRGVSHQYVHVTGLEA
jgi:hypothetical protein